MKRVITYSDPANDDFATWDIKTRDLPDDYAYFPKFPVRRMFAFGLYHFIVTPIIYIIQKINDQPVKNIDELQKIVKEASTSNEPVLYIQGYFPTGKKAYFAVDLSE